MAGRESGREFSCGALWKRGLAAAGLVFLGGVSVKCVEPEKTVQLEGVVLEERYERLSEYSSLYLISLRTSGGLIAVDIRDTSTAGNDKIKKEVLEILIQPGSRVRISVPERQRHSSNFNVEANDVTLLPNEK